MMDDETAIGISEAHLAREGLSTDGLTAHVRNPMKREHEVAFSLKGVAPEGASQAEHRVVVGKFSDFLGVLLAAGTRVRHTGAPLRPENGEEPVDAATRYLAAHGVDVTVLQSRLVQPPRVLKVWYKIDSEQDFMGGGYEVYIATDTGTVISSFEMQ